MIAFKTYLGGDDEKKLAALRSYIDRNGRSEVLMELFYKYIEDLQIVNPALKQQAFSYWGDYFSSITFIFLGVCFSISMLPIALISTSLSWLRLVILLLVLFLILWNWHR
jgi:hypothetical protein